VLILDRACSGRRSSGWWSRISIPDFQVERHRREAEAVGDAPGCSRGAVVRERVPHARRGQRQQGRDRGLLPLEGYLRASPKVGLITTRDDIIVAPGELTWLRKVFGPKATVLDTGGHCGNYQRRDFVDALTRFFRG
jgi:hypothetical protein